MDGRTDGRTDGWMDGSMDGSMYGWAGGRGFGRTGQVRSGQDRQIARQMDVPNCYSYFLAGSL